MNRLFKTLFGTCAAAIFAFGISAPVQAAYPERPVTLVCPFGAGSGADRIIRVILPDLEKAFGQKIIMDYKAGGGGVVGSNYFMSTKSDGYTLLFYNQPHISLQSRFQKTAYNNDNLIPLLGITWRPEILTVPADSPFKTLKDLVEYAKANPGKLTIGNTGSMSSNHLSYATFVKEAGIKATRLPFENGGKMNAALLGGQIDAAFSNMQWLSVYPGKLRALASTAQQRPNPDIPTFKELGYPNMIDITAINVIYAKKGTPQDVIDTLKAKIAPLISDPNIKSAYEKAGIDYGMFDNAAMTKLTEQFVKQIDFSAQAITDSMK